MEAILNCKPEDLEDYYGLLGCDELSSVSSTHWGSVYLLGETSAIFFCSLLIYSLAESSVG